IETVMMVVVVAAGVLTCIETDIAAVGGGCPERDVSALVAAIAPENAWVTGPGGVMTL
ncbi:hypothetical protein GOEFS_100_00020, partial [Gordonia effusa NBRC 100432]